jgi:hypothetical protein
LNVGVETPESLLLSDPRYEELLEIFERDPLRNAALFPRLARRLLRHFFVLWSDRFYSLNALALRSQRKSVENGGLSTGDNNRIVKLRYGVDIGGIRDVYFDESDELL